MRDNHQYWEYDDGYPFAVVGNWDAWDLTNLGRPGTTWKWTEMVSWKEFFNW